MKFGKRVSYVCYRILRFFVWLFHPKMKLQGQENLPEGPAILVGNHSQMNGPITGELYVPGLHYIWTVGDMMHLKDVPSYSYRDFWSGKPRGTRWFYHLLSYLIAPIAVCIFNNAHCIGVYHDRRIISTFRESCEVLQQGARVVIFPEHYVPHNNIICEFQDGFVELARYYYRKYKVEVPFVPMYVSASLKTVSFGKPVPFDASAPIEEEKARIAEAMMDGVTDLATSLPEHRVVPYPNLSKKHYPTNKMTDVAFDARGVFTLGEDKGQ